MKPVYAAADHRLIKAESGTLVWSEPQPGGGRSVVKLYRNRPLHDALRRLFTPYRVEREFRILELLHRQGVPCPEPLHWSHGRDRVHGLHELLATREIEGAIPLFDLLSDGGAAAPGFAPLFALGRRMHECGVAHGAFYPRNILVTAPRTAPAFHVIDFAHGRVFRRSVVDRRPGDYDLLDMLQTIARQAPIDRAPAWLEAYGLSRPRAQSLLERLSRHRIERPWRHFRRIAVDALAIRDRAGFYS
jgi:tRNA A-37 threonylcarbamoyl transferase component Bud32